MHILFVFLDGIGIGDNDPNVNPFCTANTPTLTTLTNGKRWVKGIGKQRTDHSLFIPTDPRMGVAGRPQSGTGHATIITGKNIPQMVGEHYGPKPNAATREIVSQGSIYTDLLAHGKTAAMLTAYPPHLLKDIARGKTLPSALQQAAMNAGLNLRDADDLRAGNALSADWTGIGWHKHLKIDDVPLLSLEEGGKKMVELSRQFDFALHSHTFTDYVGHRGTLEQGVTMLENFDTVMAGALAEWNHDEGLIIITSDHGNMEQIGSRNHTENDVPTLVIGSQSHAFDTDFSTLADLVPTMRHILLT